MASLKKFVESPPFVYVGHLKPNLDGFIFQKTWNKKSTLQIVPSGHREVSQTKIYNR